MSDANDKPNELSDSEMSAVWGGVLPGGVSGTSNPPTGGGGGVSPGFSSDPGGASGGSGGLGTGGGPS
jgi:hypothetical protein